MPARDDRSVLDCSPFLARLTNRHPGWLPGLREAGRLEADHPPAAEALTDEIAKHGLDQGLRHFRNREMLRITWREIARTASLEQTMGDLTRLAECCLQGALSAHDAALADDWGAPLDRDGRRLSLSVLGLGKLGGFELNLSSDVDLVLCYPHDGECDGPRRRSASEYFMRLARAVVRSLSEVTADGFCFRVDTRLRPFGDSGPLVCSFGAMEQYYQRDGRDWERYALVKARPVAGDLAAGAELLELLSPFVYRRYIDFGAVESLRDMLGSIHEDAAKKGREDDVKRGPGGIREVEFLVQCLQLLRGGREPALQTTSLLGALAAAGRLGLFPAGRVQDLGEAYEFLRRTENAVQALHDHQTHVLPSGPDGERVARIMGFDDLVALREGLGQVRAVVSQALQDSFPRPDPSDGSSLPWRRRLEEHPELQGKPFADFATRMSRIRLSPQGNDRLERFMPLLMAKMSAADLPPAVQDDVLELVFNVSRRSAYLSLLVENPQALDRMLELFAASGWIAQRVTRYPALLDELIDPALGRALPEPAEMQASVARLLDLYPDEESSLRVLNELKSATELRIAVAELGGIVTTREAEQLLTELARALLGGCLSLSEQLMFERHGGLAGSGLGVIAYGTLGAGEMSYGSDLDIIFLYAPGEGASDGERPLEAEPLFTRLARRMLSLVTTTSPAGRLYEVDTRLRPNGRAGLLVSSLDAFGRYQSSEAWVWELQALVRARHLVGDPGVAGAFERIRREVLGTRRDRDTLRREVRDMRQRMRAEFVGRDPCKHGHGGLVDIDFLTQLGVLESAPGHPELLAYTGTLDLLPRLGAAGWIAERDAAVLAATHRELARARHRRALVRDPDHALPDSTAAWAVCRPFLDPDPPG